MSTSKQNNMDEKFQPKAAAAAVNNNDDDSQDDDMGDWIVMGSPSVKQRCSGTLEKYPTGRSGRGLLSKWNSRYFGLDDNGLLSYRDNVKGSVKGTFALGVASGCRLVANPSTAMHAAATSPDRDLLICLTHHHDSNGAATKELNLLLRAPNREAKAMWLSALTDVVTDVDIAPDSKNLVGLPPHFTAANDPRPTLLEVLTAFYGKFAPEKVGTVEQHQVDKALSFCRGNEAELRYDLEGKYKCPGVLSALRKTFPLEVIAAQQKVLFTAKCLAAIETHFEAHFPLFHEARCVIGLKDVQVVEQQLRNGISTDCFTSVPEHLSRCELERDEAVARYNFVEEVETSWRHACESDAHIALTNDLLVNAAEPLYRAHIQSDACDAARRLCAEAALSAAQILFKNAASATAAFFQQFAIRTIEVDIVSAEHSEFQQISASRNSPSLWISWMHSAPQQCITVVSQYLSMNSCSDADALAVLDATAGICTSSDVLKAAEKHQKMPLFHKWLERQMAHPLQPVILAPTSPTTAPSHFDPSAAMDSDVGLEAETASSGVSRNPPPGRCFRAVAPISAESAIRLVLGMPPPPNRPDLASDIADDDDINVFEHNLASEFAYVIKKSEAAKLVNDCGLTHDEVKMLIAYKMENPFKFYAWFNAWLVGTRRDDGVKDGLGPAFVLLYRALEKLPRVTVDASRGVAVKNIPALKSLFEDHKSRLAAGMPLNFWSVSSFSTDDTIMQTFTGGPKSESIVYSCPQLLGVEIDAFTPRSLPPEKEIIPLPPAMFEVISTVKPSPSNLVVTLGQIDNSMAAYVKPSQPTLLPASTLQAQQVSSPLMGSPTSASPFTSTSLKDEAKMWAVKGDILRAKGRSASMSSEDGDQLISVDCYVNALKLDPHLSRAWGGVCFFAAAEETIMIDGMAYTPRECAIKAYSLDSQDCVAMVALGRTLANGDHININGRTITSAQQLFIDCVTQDPEFAPGWRYLLRTLGSESAVVVNGRSFSHLEVADLALQLNTNNAYNWFAMGCSLSDHGKPTCIVHDEEFTAQELFVEALKRDPTLVNAWFKLATTVAAGDSIGVNGAMFTEQQLYIEALKRDSAHASAWNRLGLTVPVGESIRVNADVYTKQELYLEALKHDPTDANAWFNLGARLPSGESIRVNGDVYTKQQIYLEALKNSPKDANAWFNLAVTLSTGESVRVNDVTYAKQQLYLEALKHNSQHASAWFNLGSSLHHGESIGVNGISYTKQELSVEALRHNSHHASAWFKLGHTLPAGESILVNGLRYTQQELYLEALNHNFQHAGTWLNLGVNLPADESINVNGTTYTRQQLFIETLRHNSKEANAWNNLATTVATDESIIINGVTYTQRQLSIEVLKHSPTNGTAWNQLGASMSVVDDECINVNGAVYTQLQLFTEALKHDPKNDGAWNNMAAVIAANESISVNGTTYSKQQLYLEALKHNPTYAHAWLYLGTTVPVDKSVSVNGTVFTQQQLFIEALKYDSENAKTWNDLASTLTTDESINVNGEMYTTHELFAESLAHDANNSCALSFLGNALHVNESINIDGDVYTKQQLLAEALTQNPTDAVGWYTLAMSLAPNESVSVDGDIFTQQQLFVESLSRDPTSSYAWSSLGLTVPEGESVCICINSDTTSSYTQKQLFVEALNHDSENATAWKQLGRTVTTNDDCWKELLVSGDVYTQQQLILRALLLNPTDALLWWNLATTLAANERIRVNGDVYTKQQLYAESLTHGPTDASAENLQQQLEQQPTSPVRNESISFNNNNGEQKYTKQQQLYLEVLRRDPTDEHAWNQLGLTLPAGESILVNGDVYTEQQLFIESLKHDPWQSNDGAAWNNLASTMTANESVTINGDTFTQQQLFAESLTPGLILPKKAHDTSSDIYTYTKQQQLHLKVLKRDATDANAWNQLGLTLPTGESICVNGEMFTEQQLYIEALKRDRTNACAWKQLGITAAGGNERVRVDGGNFTKQQLLAEALKHDPNDAMMWCSLATTVPVGASINVNGKYYTKHQLFAESLAYDPNDANAWNQLGITLPARESILINGFAFTQRQQLFAEALRCDPTDAQVWMNVAMTVAAGEESICINDNEYSKEQLFAESLTQDPSDASVWNQLGLALPAGETIFVNGDIYTKQQLLAEALKHDPNDALMWWNLATTTAADETISVNSSSYTKEQLFAEALVHDPNDANVWGNEQPGQQQQQHCSSPDDVWVHIYSDRCSQQQQLYLEVLRRDPTDATAWSRLGLTVPAGESILVNGDMYTEQQLFVEALKHDPSDASAWGELELTLSTGDSISVNGVMRTKGECSAKGSPNNLL